ncbi:hydroxysqualene dehydroxylase HpnE [Neisseria musculi]|uniref:Flavin containing amine oxidoreductase family protein n=1 Tax=Neisseria musculi TaxID=1815583 RepID=A0A7H1MDV7_9NEIS|nr:hydroxysqualene dehydroxylase HpnE [Neisseria musculi]QNT59822.1 flavin containing amine oxidoreductase family protein [Neisseria musculi]
MKPTAHRPKIAVIGAGWAGLSAAVRLAGRADVSLFEAGRRAGGRARMLAGGQAGFSFLDNGQHIMLGAYHGVLALMQLIGVSEQNAFLRLPLQWHMAGGLQFQTASLPAPLHIVFGLLKAKNLRFGEKTKLLNDMHALQQYQEASPLPDMAVAQWLLERNISRKLNIQFWRPLVWGALNTPLEHASLRMLCNVLQDGVWSGKAGSDYLLPKQDLGSIIAEPALAFLAAHGAAVHLETRAARLTGLPDGRVAVNGQAFDAAIPAVAPYHAAALMPSETPDSVVAAFNAVRHHAITTVYLRYAETVHLPAPLTGLAEGTAQWFVQRGALGLPANETAAVISLSDLIGRLKPEEWAARVHADLKTLCPYLGEPLAVRVITEQRAAAAATVARTLPDLSWLHLRRIYPAGDYLHPRYPSTLEAAVQSGLSAADVCYTDCCAVKNAF